MNPQQVMHVVTMYGLEQGFIDPHDTVPRRTLKSLLRKNMPQLVPKIQARIEQALAQELESKGSSEGNYLILWSMPRVILSRPLLGAGWRAVPALSLAKRLSAHINNQVLVGDHLGRLLNSKDSADSANMESASNSEFSKSALRYSYDVVAVIMVCRHVPRFMAR